MTLRDLVKLVAILGAASCSVFPGAREFDDPAPPLGVVEAERSSVARADTAASAPVENPVLLERFSIPFSGVVDRRLGGVFHAEIRDESGDVIDSGVIVWVNESGLRCAGLRLLRKRGDGTTARIDSKDGWRVEFPGQRDAHEPRTLACREEADDSSFRRSVIARATSLYLSGGVQ